MLLSISNDGTAFNFQNKPGGILRHRSKVTAAELALVVDEETLLHLINCLEIVREGGLLAQDHAEGCLAQEPPEDATVGRVGRDAAAEHGAGGLGQDAAGECPLLGGLADMNADVGRIVPDGMRVADLVRVDEGDPALLLEDFGTAKLEEGAVGHVVALDVDLLDVAGLGQADGMVGFLRD